MYVVDIVGENETLAKASFNKCRNRSKQCAPNFIIHFIFPFINTLPYNFFSDVEHYLMGMKPY